MREHQLPGVACIDGGPPRHTPGKVQPQFKLPYMWGGGMSPSVAQAGLELMTVLPQLPKS